MSVSQGFKRGKPKGYNRKNYIPRNGGTLRLLPLNKGQTLQTGAKIGRNKPCPCGSMKKFKRCCGS